MRAIAQAVQRGHVVDAEARGPVEPQAVGQESHRSRASDRELGEAAAADLRHHAIAHRKARDAGADRIDTAGNLVAGNVGQGRLHLVAAERYQRIDIAHAAGRDRDAHLASRRFRQRQLDFGVFLQRRHAGRPYRFHSMLSAG